MHRLALPPTASLTPFPPPHTQKPTQIVQRAFLGGGPNQHRQMILRAEQRFLDLEGRPLWIRVVRDPRIGAFHAFSGALRC